MKLNILKKKKSREIALQIIYSWKLSNIDIKLKIKEINYFNFNKNIDQYYHNIIIYGVINNIKNIKNYIKKNINKNTKYIDIIEKIILYIAIYEYKNLKTPYKVIINESIELAKKFSTQNSYKLINSILDKILIKK